MIKEHLHTFAGCPVIDWHSPNPSSDLSQTAVRIRVDFEDDSKDGKWGHALQSFLDNPASAGCPALIAGNWSGGISDPVVQALCQAAGRLPKLQALFIGDITFEESEISWIEQSDLGPLFKAFPQLREFGARGANVKINGIGALTGLVKLVVETGGMLAEVPRALVKGDLSNLEHLELYLGTSEYGGTVEVADLAPLLSGKFFPKLRYLGLRDSENADEVARAVAGSPLLQRIETLDLSLGTLGEAGAEALLASPHLSRLRKLDIHHHYIGAELVGRLRSVVPDLNADDYQCDDDDDRYVAVGE